jgi:hypothetical protein
MEIEDYLKYQSGLKKDIIGTDGVAQCATWKGKPGPCKIENSTAEGPWVAFCTDLAEKKDVARM